MNQDGHSLSSRKPIEKKKPTVEEAIDQLPDTNDEATEVIQNEQLELEATEAKE